MSPRLITLLVLLGLTAISAAAPEAKTQVLSAAAEAMGGWDKLRPIKVVKAEFFSHSYALEESERPEGSWFSNYFHGTATMDFDAAVVGIKAKMNGLLAGTERDFTVDWSPTRPLAGDYFMGIAGRTRLALGPERLLDTALVAKDLRLDKPIQFHEIPHDVLRFTWGSVPVRIFINHQSHLPAAVETVQLGQGFWTIWGDVTERVTWGNWDIAPGGVMYPTLWSTERNGLRQEDDSLTKVDVQYGEPITRDLAPPAPTAPRLFPSKAVEIAPGVIQYQSGFNCAAVDQGDGIVILEGVVSTEYMAATVADVTKRFPGKPIKAVLTTDDAWPHIGGLRYFVAHKIPIYAMPLNKPILTRLFDAPFTIRPDELAQTPAKPIFRFVTGKTVLGSGPNQLTIYPMFGSVTERMLYADLPGRKLLYAPDVIQHEADHWFNVNLVREMLLALSRDMVHAEMAFAFHSEPISIAALSEVVAKASK